MSDYDMSIHSSTDAREWTDFFFKTHPNCNVDRETLFGWFANAMMAMYDNKQNEPVPVAWMSTKREPLSDDEVIVPEWMIAQDERQAFVIGVRFAEKMHGIGVLK